METENVEYDVSKLENTGSLGYRGPYKAPLPQNGLLKILTNSQIKNIVPYLDMIDFNKSNVLKISNKMLGLRSKI